MRTRAQEEQEKPPAARTRLVARRRLPMSSKSTQEKRKTPPKSSASTPAKESKTPRSSPATVSSAGGSAVAGSAPGSSTKAPRPRNFGNIEDQLLCRAYVNVSCNPVVGTDQKRKIFWESIKYRYEDLYTREGVTEEDGKVERTWDALANRYQKKIQPEMNLFMSFYKRVAECPPSGTPKKAARAPAIPIKVCFLTTFLEVCLKTFLDKNPAVAAHIATSGASGPKLPPANIVNKLKRYTKDVICMRRIYDERRCMVPYPHINIIISSKYSPSSHHG